MAKTNLVLAAAAVAFPVACLVLFKDLSTERNRVLALEAQVAQLQRDMKHPEPAAPEPPAQPAAVQPAATPSRSTASTPAATAKPAVVKKSAERDRQRSLYADPTYRAALVADYRLRLLLRYPQLAADLGLSTEEVDRFFDLLAEQSLQESESAMKKQPGDNVQERHRKLFEKQEQERREFLGDQRFQLWTEYVNSAGARRMVGELRTQLATTSSPLREEQVKPLVKALAAEQQRHWAERLQNWGSNDQWTHATIAERVAHMERRARLVEESVARSKEAGAMYLDSTQQRSLDAMLERQSESAWAEIASSRALWEAEERQRGTR